MAKSLKQPNVIIESTHPSFPGRIEVPHPDVIRPRMALDFRKMLRAAPDAKGDYADPLITTSTAVAAAKWVEKYGVWDLPFSSDDMLKWIENDEGNYRFMAWVAARWREYWGKIINPTA